MSTNIPAAITEAAARAADEHGKFNAGNKSAGTRARKLYQEIKKLAQQGREEIQGKKNAE